MNLFICHHPQIDEISYSLLKYIFTYHFFLIDWSSQICKRNLKVRPQKFRASCSSRHSSVHAQDLVKSSCARERSACPDSPLEVKPLQVYSPMEHQALSTSITFFASWMVIPLLGWYIMILQVILCLMEVIFELMQELVMLQSTQAMLTTSLVEVMAGSHMISNDNSSVYIWSIFFIICTLINLTFGLHNNLIFRIFTCLIYFCR